MKPTALIELEALIPPEKAEAYNNWLNRWITEYSAEKTGAGPIIIDQAQKERSGLALVATMKAIARIPQDPGAFLIMDGYTANRSMTSRVIILRESPMEGVPRGNAK